MHLRHTAHLPAGSVLTSNMRGCGYARPRMPVRPQPIRLLGSVALDAIDPRHIGLVNVEGTACVRSPAGCGVRLYLISDDNFQSFQRTLLLAFDWPTAPAG